MTGRFVLPLSLRFALSDVRGGLAGFGIFLACMALGVGAITGVGAVSRSLVDGLAREGGAILGGDVSFALIQREMLPAETAALAQGGQLSSIALLRSMARLEDGASSLIEIKAVGSDWPVRGSAVLDPPLAVPEALALRDGAYGVVADAALGAKLDIKTGDFFKVGEARFQLRATLVSEPDRLAGGIGFGPRVLMSVEALRATGLIQPGSLVRWVARVTLGAGLAGAQANLVPASDSQVDAFVAQIAKALPDAGWEVRTRNNVSPQFSKNLERFTQFLVLVGLTALVVGGVGMANAVRAFVERRRADAATFKALGATGGHVVRILLVQIVMVGLIGIALGLVVGAALPFVVAGSLKAFVPFPVEPVLYPQEMGKGLIYGLLTLLVFSLGPLGAAHDTPVSALFRDAIEPARQRLRLVYMVSIGLCALMLMAACLWFMPDRKLVLIFMGGILIGFGILRLVASALMWAAKHVPHPKNPGARLALANLYRPGALTPSVVLSLGLGLALLVCLTLIDGNIRNQLRAVLPGQTPSFFFIDIPGAQGPAFDAFLQEHAEGAKTSRVPMMRGRIVRIGDLKAEDVKAGEDVAWVLEGDRGITFADSLPEGSSLVAGEWWPADYKGPPLVSLEADIAKGLGIGVGDTLAVNVLGRTVNAKIANLRKVNWRTLGINFVMVFSSSSFAGAPRMELATVTFEGPSTQQAEMGLMRDVARAFPAITSVRVKDALDAVNQFVAQLALATRGASGIALLASVLVLAGALAAGQQARTYDAVVLKVLGATRGRLVRIMVLEYGLIGIVTALFGCLAGAGAAWMIVTQIMKFDFVWLWSQSALIVVGAVAVTILLGLAGTWRILGQRPSAWLKSL